MYSSSEAQTSPFVSCREARSPDKAMKKVEYQKIESIYNITLALKIYQDPSFLKV